ncbi:MAG TPA: CerR family C-terminal domain-containing protein [Humidesulfovibrio sp.]|uniref:CerR family C-terminal domain-containing protein n=1 Tax=Humidesulfovibrio sp. TaxID=2910988 RepID=UPI002B9AD9EA|nr:CerR family C-terminal domain-containing protein [Humidesulfovibrio sp.]HWR03823.1 CerR family C-terminal domain-containing protein [Humidesulfovibrio sp.]
MKRQPPKNADKETRKKLIEAGTKLFGLHGFDATSTRALAQEAGVNLSGILYHFGGKEGLYRAVMEQGIEAKLTEIGPGMLCVVATCGNPSSTREELLESMRFLVRTLVSVMLGSPESRSFSQIMMQEQIAPTAAFTLFHDGFFAKVHGVWTTLLGRLLNRQDSLELRLRALSVMGQLVIFRVGMSGILRVVGGDRLTDEHLECITRLCIEQVEAIVAGCAPETGQAEGGR